MKIGIIGDASRAVAWEKHVRPHRIVTEVKMSTQLDKLDDIDACLLILDDTNNLDALLNIAQHGIHCFVISKMPTNIADLRQIHSAASETGAIIQFSHWPSLAPATLWISDNSNKIDFINIQKYVPRTKFIDANTEFRNAWIDELGFCLKLADSGLHHIEAKEIRFSPETPIAIHLFLRFDSGGSASIFVNASSDDIKHTRTISDKKQIFECSVHSQTLRIGKLADNQHIFYSKESFDSTLSAAKSVSLFFKAIQLQSEPVYSVYDAFILAKYVQKVENRLLQFS